MEGSQAVPPSPTEKPKAPGTAKRKKVNHACVYCRRSHMTCDSERPCTRCVKRNIGHLCHDEIKEAKTKSPKRDATSSPSAMASTAAAVKTEPDGQSTVIDSQMMRPPAGPAVYANNMQVQSNNKSSGQATTSQQTTQRTAEGQNAAPTTGLQNGGIGDELSTFYDSSLFGLPPDTYSQFASEHTNSEFLVLSDFLSIMGDPNGTFPNSPNLNAGSLYPANGYAFSDFKEDNLTAEQQKALQATSAQYTLNGSLPQSRAPSNAPSRVASRRASFSNVAKSTTSADSSTAQEKFFLTAADPNPESPEDRLKQVINAKVEAGLMKPFNYVRGYARLQKYMDQNMSADSRSRILAPLSTFRPAFRGIAKRLTDVDLILVEEAFERLLLDYDRVFTSMAVPACLWRRTGEIFRGNKEFAALLNLPVGSLRDGKLAITELMAEDSAVNYWEKYGDIAFDGQQKAVLTSCLLQVPGDQKGAVVSCCFSFTIKRDRYNIPSCIVGNFIPITL